VQRAAGIFVGGIVLGVLIAFAVMRITHPPTSPVVPAPSIASSDSRKPEPSSHGPNDKRDKVILGDIATVPFQELYGVLSARSSDEIAELARQLNNLPPGRDTKAKITTLFKAWAQLDARAALTAAAALKTAEAKSVAIGAVVASADTTSAQSLAMTLNQLSAEVLSPTERTIFLDKALSKWSELDPVAAAKFLDSVPSSNAGFFGARMNIARNWAATDPGAALAWAQAQGDTRDARSAISGVISGWWENDPRAAEAYVNSHLDTIGIGAAMNITSQLFRRDPQQAKDWASRLPTPEARRNADSYIAMQMANLDPKGASEWAASLPDDVRSQVLSGTISKWARTDRAAAEQWINNLNGTTRDEAIGAYSSTMGFHDPAAGLTWAASVSDPKIRSATVERIVRNWMRRSPGDATTWIQNSTLAESEKTRLLAPPAGR
jgi:hypothetical protein